VPILVDGRVVHWVDSKGMFGDATAWKYARTQVEEYVACFGPGMVVFWQGCHPELQDAAGPSVLVAPDFPDRDRVRTLEAGPLDLAAYAR